MLAAARGLAGTMLLGAVGAVGAAAQEAPLSEILVTATTPLPGTTIDLDLIPGTVQSIRAADLRQDGTASLAGALDARLSGISITDALDDRVQPDIYYRGFAASPLLGTAQGLAVYQDGVRINEAFGDTVNWDLVPDVAIARVDVVSSSPLYGLNALGGAVAITMKNGFDFRAGEAEIDGGSFNQRAGSMQYGSNDGRFGFYAAVRMDASDGWRRFAHDAVRQLYADVSQRRDGASIDLSLTHADNQLNGQSAAPVQELAISPVLSFTNPQQVGNRLDFLTLNASGRAGPTLSWQAALYLRDYEQRVANGNTTSFTVCAAAAQPGLLCQRDGVTRLHDAAGAPVAIPPRAGGLVLGEDDAERVHSLGSGASLQASNSALLLGHKNVATIGVSLDAAHVDFSSSIVPGRINGSLWVEPAGPVVVTPESSPFISTPVALRATTRYAGLYLTDTLSAGKALALTASARANEATVDLADQRGTALNGRKNFDHLNPAIGATLKVRPDLTAYANYSTTNRVPTASEIECSDARKPCLLPSSLAADPPTLRQVVAATIEFGLRGKHETGRTVASWTLAAFRAAISDDIFAIATSTSSGYFRNIGATRRAGIEAGIDLRAAHWSAYAQWSLVDASFRTTFTEHSPSNPYADAAGNLPVNPGNRLPGIPRDRIKAGAELNSAGGWSVGVDAIAVGSRYYSGDEANRNAPLPGFATAGLHAAYRRSAGVELFAAIHNLFDKRHANYGLYGNPAGIGAPGVTGGDNRFQSPAAPRAYVAGIRLTF